MKLSSRLSRGVGFGGAQSEFISRASSRLSPSRVWNFRHRQKVWDFLVRRGRITAWRRFSQHGNKIHRLQLHHYRFRCHNHAGAYCHVCSVILKPQVVITSANHRYGVTSGHQTCDRTTVYIRISARFRLDAVAFFCVGGFVKHREEEIKITERKCFPRRSVSRWEMFLRDSEHFTLS